MGAAHRHVPPFTCFVSALQEEVPYTGRSVGRSAADDLSLLYSLYYYYSLSLTRPASVS